MHAILDHNSDIARTLDYHEKKVSLGIAECLTAGNAIKDLEHLSLRDKLYHFERRNVQNDMIKKKVLHVALAFPPSEKEQLSNQKMQAIAEQYLQQMGLLQQPYLIYRHYDSLHPHCHIVCSKIQQGGKNIVFTLKHYFQSKKLTQELEREHALVSRDQPTREYDQLPPIPLQKVVYQKTTLLPAFSRILDAVIDNYKFTSLPELNAVLSLYNMEAYRGKENRDVYQKKGLYYRTFIDNTNRQVRIKASVLDRQPTLPNLEQHFQLNQSDSQRPQHRQRIMTAIDWTLVKSKLTLTDLKKNLEKERISAVFQHDKAGTLQHIFYVDHQNKSVFDGASLGDRYTAAGIKQRCIPPLTPQQVQERAQQQKRQKQLDQEQELER